MKTKVGSGGGTFFPTIIYLPCHGHVRYVDSHPFYRAKGRQDRVGLHSIISIISSDLKNQSLQGSVVLVSALRKQDIDGTGSRGKNVGFL